MNEELRAELLRRQAADQEARMRWIELTKDATPGQPQSAEALEVGQRVAAIDEENTAWLRGIVREHGWPGRSLVGDQAANAAWLLVQHSDRDPGFQRECLDLLQAAVEAGEGSARDLAYLMDRVLLAEGKRQRYGTQFTAGATGWEPQPLEDPDRVDERRAGVGLPPLEEYARQLRELYGAPPSRLGNPGSLPVAIRPLRPEHDRPLVERLWAATLAGTWPVLPGALALVKTGLVAEIDEEMVGAVVSDEVGSILLVLVSPSHQRLGVGRRLVEATLADLAAAGTTSVCLGSGGADSVWPGIPLDLPGAVAFFESLGWGRDEVVVDMVRDLTDFSMPLELAEQAAAAGVSFTVAGPDSLPDVLSFEDARFPSWSRWFRGGDTPILVGRTDDGRIVSSLLFDGPNPGMLFAPILGASAGAIACVGVDERWRGLGIGTAMVGRASELLRDRGTGACHIGWTTRQEFYGRLGYRVWRTYQRSCRPIAELLTPGARVRAGGQTAAW
jgi:GNAT superfamily N-acetyltransferase